MQALLTVEVRMCTECDFVKNLLIILFYQSDYLLIV
ncbi:hypothetical protein DN38_1704 [Vibrio cholerae]|nr:hypothetical protein DN38_1704 [Vibrio cholerae]